MTKPRCFSFDRIYPESVADIEKFGELHPLFGNEGRPSVFDPTIKEAIDAALQEADYDNDVDYIVVVKGNIVGLAQLIAVVSSLYGPVKALLFSTKDNKYIPTTIGLKVEGVD